MLKRFAIVTHSEAAIRLIRAVQELNCEQHLSLSTVALFTEPDRQAMFVREADDAVYIGPATFIDQRDGQRKSSYLDRGHIEQALLAAHVDAVWVGWDLLAEKVWFADLCQRLGIVFIGPSTQVLERLSNKISAKQLAQQANIPVVPWSGRSIETEGEARQYAERLRYPLVIKPAVGRRGLGIHYVSSSSELASAFKSARDEARRAFDDPTVFLEDMIDGAHHVEVQIIADNYGTTWAVGVRDCTVQRRGQKILEESSSPMLSPGQERELHEAAVRLCQLVGYQNTGSVEFLYDPIQHQFWFLEVNPYLSAGHPVTEAVTGLDLVKLQLEVARGGHLEGEPPVSIGHGIEAHLYAETADNGFASSSGRLELFRLASGPGLRVDTSYNETDFVHSAFNPVLATIAAWGRNRQEALARLSCALTESAVLIRAGMSNKALLLALLHRPELESNHIDTLWLDSLILGEAHQARQHADVALLQAAVEAYNAEQRVEQAEFSASAARGQPKVRQSAEHDLLSYLRFRDTRVERLPMTFLDNLQRALAHYGVRNLDPSPELDESLLLIYTSHQHVNQQLAAILAILERHLEHVDKLALAVTGEMSRLLDRLLLATQGRYPAIHDLTREVRFRYFDKPLFEQARNKVYEEMRAHLASLAVHPDATDRDERMSALVACPQPMQNLLTRRFPEADDHMRQLMLEALTRRYYRMRQLEDFECTTVDGQTFVKAAYDYNDTRIIIVTTFSMYADLATAATAMSHFVNRYPDENGVVIDFYAWRSDPLGEAETTGQEIRTILDTTNFTHRLRRIVVAVSTPGKGLGMASTQHFTYRPGENGYQEERLYRGLHPMMGERLHIWRLANFQIERLPSVEDVYLFHGIARDNPKDERLFALAEVRDITPLRDESGKIIQIPHLERMLMEALESIRLYQSRLPVHKHLPWNRVLLYVWPPLGLQPEEFLEIMQKLWPATEGLGLERIVLHAKIAEPETGQLRDSMLHLSHSSGRELVLRESAPIETPIATLSEYRQKVVQLRQRGLIYPYELIEMLTREPEGIHTQIPPGHFTEYDLDENNRLVPVDRPYGRNKAGIVVGVIRNYTSKYPEGMARVILLGDPSQSLGSVAEPECRRINEAINLAERLQVPVEWFALSAGAKISMESGTENMDWVARTLRRIIEFTHAGGEINVIVNGINVGAQAYWNSGATMLMHTRGILIMTPNGAMVLTGKQSLDYSGGVSAEDNYGIGGYERIMGPNGQAQYFAPDLSAACQILMRHYHHTYVMPGERFPRRAQTSDAATRDVRSFPYFSTWPEDSDFTCIGDLFSHEKNPGRKRAFGIRTVMTALIDADHKPLERWNDMRDADTVIVWDAHIGGYPVTLLGIESRPIPRRGFIPGDGPEQWTAGTLFPMSSKKAARAINSTSGNRPLVVLANLSGCDGSPESLRNLELEYGAEIGRAVANFKGPLVLCVVSRYHGGAFVVFSKALNENLEVAVVEGSYASIIGGVPAAAVVFAREVDTRTKNDPRVKNVQEQLAQANGPQKSALQLQLNEVTAMVHSEKVGEVASEFDHLHNIQRAQRVGSIDHVIPPADIRPYLIEALERGMQR